MVVDLVERLTPQSGFVSALTALEITSALRRREASHEISSYAANAAIDQLGTELTRCTVLDLSPGLLSDARSIIHRHRLRALDAIQLASAVSLTARASASLITFVGSDAQLLKAAAAAGLATMNPADE